MNKRVSVVSLGCAKNLVDSEILVGGLKKEEFKIPTQYINSKTNLSSEEKKRWDENKK